MMAPMFRPGTGSVLRSLRGLGETCPYIGPANGQPPVRGACTDDLYQFGVVQDNKLNCWIPKFVQAVRDAGFTPRVVGNYVPPGNGNCGYTTYNVYWDVLFEGKSVPCGIYVADIYQDSDPKDIVEMAVVGCRAAAGAASAGSVVQTTVKHTPAETAAEKVANATLTTAAPEPISPAASVWDKLVNTFTGDGGESGPAVPASGLSSIPTWAWVASGAAVLFFMSGRGK